MERLGTDPNSSAFQRIRGEDGKIRTVAADFPLVDEDGGDPFFDLRTRLPDAQRIALGALTEDELGDAQLAGISLDLVADERTRRRKNLPLRARCPFCAQDTVLRPRTPKGRPEFVFDGHVTGEAGHAHICDGSGHTPDGAAQLLAAKRDRAAAERNQVDDDELPPEVDSDTDPDVDPIEVAPAAPSSIHPSGLLIPQGTVLLPASADPFQGEITVEGQIRVIFGWGLPEMLWWEENGSRVPVKPSTLREIGRHRHALTAVLPHIDPVLDGDMEARDKLLSARAQRGVRTRPGIVSLIERTLDQLPKNAATEAARAFARTVAGDDPEIEQFLDRFGLDEEGRVIVRKMVGTVRKSRATINQAPPSQRHLVEAALRWVLHLEGKAGDEVETKDTVRRFLEARLATLGGTDLPGKVLAAHKAGGTDLISLDPNRPVPEPKRRGRPPKPVLPPAGRPVEPPDPRQLSLPGTVATEVDPPPYVAASPLDGLADLPDAEAVARVRGLSPELLPHARAVEQAGRSRRVVLDAIRDRLQPPRAPAQGSARSPAQPNPPRDLRVHTRPDGEAEVWEYGVGKPRLIGPLAGLPSTLREQIMAAVPPVTAGALEKLGEVLTELKRVGIEATLTIKV